MANTTFLLIRNEFQLLDSELKGEIISYKVIYFLFVLTDAGWQSMMMFKFPPFSKQT